MSYGYDRTGFNWGDSENPDCAASLYPPTPSNATLFDGQNRLAEEQGLLGRYSLQLVEESDDETVVAVVRFDDRRLEQVEGTIMLGEAIAQAHGVIMRHAAEGASASG